MKRVAGLICLLLLTGASAASAETSGTCANPFTAPADAGMRLAVFSRSAEVIVVGSDEREVKVTCTVGDSSRADEMHVRYERTGDFGKLEVTGGPSNNVHIVIELPRQTNLTLRVPAGSVRVKELSGDKDIDVHAGELIVTGVSPKQYRSVRASVQFGEVRAAAYSVAKGGMFRSFEQSTGEGLYRLDAHIITGSIQLN